MSQMTRSGKHVVGGGGGGGGCELIMWDKNSGDTEYLDELV